MAEPENLAKINARNNLISVLGSRQTPDKPAPPPNSSTPSNDPPSASPPHQTSPPENGSPLTPPPTTPSIPSSGQEITAKHLAQERLHHVKSVVKALQVETKGPPPMPPPKSPTVHRPVPRARSPHSSPSRQRTIADPTTRSARRLATPPRPPPPKFGSMKKGVSLEINTSNDSHQPSVTPPASPMRKRSLDMEKAKMIRPKPTARRRKKFNPSGDESKRTSVTEDHEAESEKSGEHATELGSHDQSHDESPDQQVNGGDAPVEQTSSDELCVLEKSGEGDQESTNQNKEDRLVDGPGEEWEMISEIPNINISSEENPLLENKPGSLKKQKSEETSPSASPAVTADNNTSSTSTTAPMSPDNRKTRKKKPPPFRPAPYTPRTPPIPPKQRKQVSSKLAEEAKKIARPEGPSPESTPEPEEHRQQLQHPPQQEEEKTEDEHVYEMIDPYHAPTPLRFVENGLGPGRTKYLGSSSSDTSVSPSQTLSRSTSVGNAESVISDVVTNRQSLGTFSLSTTLRNVVHRGESGKKTRPQSEASSNSVKDFETSFEMIPGTGSKLEDVMTTLREADEKYQDASIYELVQACSRAMPHITTTTDLPPRIPEFPTDARSLVIHELYTTEYTYVKGLEVVDEVFKIDLAPILLDETSRVFANIIDILAFNKGFLALLHTRLKEWGPEVKIGDIFIGMFTPSHKSMYAIYCSNYDSAEMMVVTRLKKRKDFEVALQTCLSNSRVMPGLTLPAYLITPVQRIPRYILLLKDIIKRTEESHPDYKNLTKALEIMGELADYINAQVSESQTKKTLDTLKNKVQGLADVDSPDRNLVKEGQVFLKNVKKLYQCILFNDLLVFAHGDSRQSIVELQLSLEAVWVEDLEDLDPQTSNEDAIEVYTPERPYTIYTQTRAEKRLWLNKLRETIYQHLRDLNKCVPDKTGKTEERYSNFVYADRRVYTGQYIDARRNGKGTMTWPNKSCYVGDWVDDERCGEGEFTYNTGDVYRGKWVEDKQNGFGELQYASDDVYRGQWKDGIRHGKGKILYSNGDTFDGQFSNGHIEGEGTLKCVNGVEYKGEWKHSQRHGKGRLRFVCGNVYTGEFQYNQIHGQGQMVYRNRDRYDGRWKNGMRNGQGKLKSRQEGEYDGSWENDLRHGFGKLKYPNGDYYEGGWELNRRHGKGKLVYSTGQVFEGEFVNDIINGEGEMQYSKTSKYHGGWTNGMRHGSGAMVYDDKSSYTGDWLNGLRYGHGEFVSADGAVYRGMWVNDKPHGKGILSIIGPQQNLSYTYSGDWVAGKREGRGEEQSQYGQYKGGWKADMKQGVGEERDLVGTIFEGSWDKGRKHGRGVRKMIFGTVEEQAWKSGQLSTDPLKMTAVELPYISRNDL